MILGVNIIGGKVSIVRINGVLGVEHPKKLFRL